MVHRDLGGVHTNTVSYLGRMYNIADAARCIEKGIAGLPGAVQHANSQILVDVGCNFRGLEVAEVVHTSQGPSLLSEVTSAPACVCKTQGDTMRCHGEHRGRRSEKPTQCLLRVWYK